ncbi:Apo-petrobactin exporter [Capillimicrobium parvum]|uniref:Apo-petrobactin exporter n=2 Tax=Capillimicrobium parvum TaxID=2884022 RepID=A0A9E6XX00_9ACTN|nr:Apo-petrobactin exporter [Capillimicrobium parvum]
MKWVVVAAWIVLAGIGASFAGKFEQGQKNEQSSFLPGSAESVKALEQTKRFPSGDNAPVVVVYRAGDGRLTRDDLRKVTGDKQALDDKPPVATGGFSGPIVSQDGTTALLVAPIKPNGESDRLVDAVDGVRTQAYRNVPDGLDVKVTGAAGFSRDAIEVFSGINGTLLFGTALLVLVLLLIIYRSPIFWLIPMTAVIFAEITARGVGYGLEELGVTVNGQTGGILPVLVFGAGTDYALLLVSRYREELRRHDDKHEAAALAMRRAGPAVLASGCTVIVALLVLMLAEVNGTSGIGPVCAVGIALAMLSMLTLLPALLAITGRRAFWPFIPHVGDEGTDETHGFWRRTGERIARRPRVVWIATTAGLLVLCLGLTQLNTDLTNGNGFRDSVDSVAGQKLLSEAFPAGANAPTNVIVGDASHVGAVRSALEKQPGVAQLGPVERGAGGARFDLTLVADPYSKAAFEQIPSLRDAAKEAGGPQTLIGGPTAQQRDFNVAAARDNRVIVPIVLIVIFLILVALLRAITAPLILIATVILSFGAALGVGSFVSMQVFGFAGLDSTYPLLVFIFLVALGVDYNIFLMARVREEAHHHGSRDGMIRGLAVTGAVITSAGIVLAGTFSLLALLPLVVLTELGFTIAFGVLLDTLVVRSILVPALTLDIGPAIWWPSKLAHHRERRRPSSDPATEPS